MTVSTSPRSTDAGGTGPTTSRPCSEVATRPIPRPRPRSASRPPARPSRPGILDRYAVKPGPDIIGPKTQELLDKILAITGPKPTEYDLALAIQDYLKDPDHFTYSPDVTSAGIVCGALPRVECFATFTTGFCRWYAATMTALMRMEGYPVRIAEGFRRPARTPDLPAGSYEVKNSDAHAWVEVYFPRYGWVDFDPTGGGRSDLAPLPTGKPEASPTGSAGALALPPIPSRGEPDDGNPGSGGRITSRVAPGPYIAIALLLALIVAVAGLRGLAARSTRPGERRWRLRHGDPPGRSVRVSGRGPARPRTSTPGRSAEVCPGPGHSWRPWPAPRSRSSTADVPSDRTASRALREAQRQLRVQLLSLLFRAVGPPAPLARRPRPGRREAPPRRRRSRVRASWTSTSCSSRSAARWPVRLWARRTAWPARNSTTVIAQRSIVHIQNRDSGRSNSVSSVILNTPSWPTTIDHGWSAGGVRVAGDLVAIARSRARHARRARPGWCRAPAGPGPRPRRAIRRPGPTPRSGDGATSRASPRSVS